MKEIVLIVDDEDTDVELLKRALRKVDPDLEVQVFADGEEIKAYLQPVLKPGEPLEFPVPRALLLDLKMPRVDGFEFLEWARGEPAVSVIPIIAVTGSIQQAELDLARALGATCCVTKVGDTSVMADELRKAFAEHAGFMPFWNASGASSSGRWGMKK